MMLRGWDAQTGWPNGPSRVSYTLTRGDHLGWNTTHHQKRGLLILKHLLHNAAAMWWKERERTIQRCPQAKPIEMAKVTSPAHPSVRTFLGSTDWETLDILEQVYQEEYVLAPSELPRRQQAEYMMDLWQELSQHIARAGLREGLAPARPTSLGWRCSHSCSFLWTQFPLVWA